jgi:hypothetical protein
MAQRTGLELRKQAEEEKVWAPVLLLTVSNLKPLICQAKLRSLYDSSEYHGTIAEEGQPCAVLPSEFVRAWRQWLTQPTTAPRPIALDNSSLLCEHEQLVFDPSDIEKDENIKVIKLGDWKTIENW